MNQEPETKILENYEPTLEEAQRVVGGYVEMVYLDGGDQLLVNEEGVIKNLPPNPSATAIAGKPIVGNAIVLKGHARWK